jgi:hypothetical protein
MISKLPVLLVSGALALASATRADDATFKAYGFADAELLKQSYNADNFLVGYGYATPGMQAYLDHVNTYLDWKPNTNVRVLAEIAFNPNPVPSNGSGTILTADSSALYTSIYNQARPLVVQELNQLVPGFSSYPPAIQEHVIDSIIAGQTSQAIAGIKANALQGNPSTGSKDHSIYLPRVHADLLLNDALNVRVGKFITPSGIWNVDHGSPTILTIKQPYETSFIPIFPESQTGVQLFGHMPYGDHDFSYAGWITTGRGTNDADFGQTPRNLDDWAFGAHLQTDLDLLDGVRLGGTVHTGTIRQSYEWDYVPVTSIDISSQIPTTDLAGSDNVLADSAYMREWSYGLDTKWNWNHFLVQAEWNHRQVLNLMRQNKSGNPFQTNFNAWYVLLGRQFSLTSSLDATPYTMYEQLAWDGTDNNPGLGYALVPISGFGTWIAGVNLGIYNRVHLKLEYSHVNLYAKNFASGEVANTYTDHDLAVDSYAAQFSVAF